MEAQAAFLHNAVRPNLRHQLLLVDDLIWADQQRDENVQRAAPKFDWRSVVCEQPFAHNQSEGTEGSSSLFSPSMAAMRAFATAISARTISQALQPAPYARDV